jgi:hypothetical protein
MQFRIALNPNLMKSIPNRIVIYAKDVEKITGRKPRTCYAILEKIRKHFKKPKNSFITAKEFCLFLNIEEELIKEFLDD